MAAGGAPSSHRDDCGLHCLASHRRGCQRGNLHELNRQCRKHFSGESQERFLIEVVGGGVAFLDFDNDGLLDLFFVTGSETPNGKDARPPRNALYRNLGYDRFEDVTAKAGLELVPLWNGRGCRQLG